MAITNQIVTLLIIICSAHFSMAKNNSIKGVITEENGTPIPFVSVAIMNTSIGVATDAYGNFELQNIDSNKITLSAHCLGFEKAEYKVDLDETNMIHIILKSKSLQLNEVLISGDGKARQIERSGFAVSSIDTKEMQIQSAEINEILDQTPGLRVRRDGGMGSKTSYNINGLSGSSVRIFIDGVPMESFGSSYSVNSIPVSLIERIDVYKGVVPTELGNDAMGGAINIITKQPEDHDGQSHALSASYSAGSFNSHRADIMGSHINANNRLTLRYSGFYNYSDNDYWVWSDDIKIKDYDEYLPNGERNPDFLTVIKTGEKVRRFNDAYESYGAKFDVGVSQTAWADQFFVSVNISSDYKERQHGPRMLTPYGERFSEGWTVAPSINYTKKDLFTEGFRIAANLQYAKSQQSTIDTTLNTYDWYGNLVPDIGGVSPIAGEAKTATLNIDDNHNYIGRLMVGYDINPNHTFGINASFNNYFRSSDDELQAAETRSYNSESIVMKSITGLNYQNQLFNRRWKNTAFAKYYYSYLEQNKIELVDQVLDTIHNERPSDYWGYGATTTFAITPRVRVNASAEKAIRLVSTNEVFGSISDEVVESVDLEPEKSLNINVGGMFQVVDYGQHKAEINTNFFFRNTYDRIRRSIIVVSDESYSYHENIGHVQSKGIELQIDYSFRRTWQVMLQGYYLDSRFMEQYADNGAENDHYLAREPNIPYLTSSAKLGYMKPDLFRSNDQLSINWYSAYIHTFHYDWDMIGKDNKPIVPAQFINDLSIAYRFSNQRLSISADGKNIFNKLAFDNYAVQKPGRAIYLKMAYTIL